MREIDYIRIAQQIYKQLPEASSEFLPPLVEALIPQLVPPLVEALIPQLVPALVEALIPQLVAVLTPDEPVKPSTTRKRPTPTPNDPA